MASILLWMDTLDLASSGHAVNIVAGISVSSLLCEMKAA
jgi:hypothetical protein